MEKIEVIVRQEELDAVCAEIHSLRRVAMDLEFIPEKTFTPVLALLQVATDRRVYVIDPRTSLKLDSLWQIVANKEIMKIFHAAKEDLNIIRQLSNLTPSNIIDTQIAAAFLGYGFPIGYKNLLSQFLNVQINKSESFTDWLMRPLSQEQLRYAYEDVLHLLPLTDKLVPILQEKERMAWVKEECEIQYSQSKIDDNQEFAFTRIKGARALSRQKLAVLKLLLDFRLETAKQSNKPLKNIISDMTLLELAKKTPRSVEAFDQMRGLNLEQARRYGKQLISLIEKGCKLSPSDWPNWPAGQLVSDAENLVGDILYALLKVQAYSLGIAPEFLATRNEIQKLITAFNRDCHEELAVLQGWRKDLIGNKLIRLLAGEIVQLRVNCTTDPSVEVFQ